MPNAMTANSTILSFTIMDCLLNLSAKLPAIGTINKKGSAKTKPTSAKIVGRKSATAAFSGQGDAQFDVELKDANGARIGTWRVTVDDAATGSNADAVALAADINAALATAAKRDGTTANLRDFLAATAVTKKSGRRIQLAATRINVDKILLTADKNNTAVTKIGFGTKQMGMSDGSPIGVTGTALADVTPTTDATFKLFINNAPKRVN